MTRRVENDRQNDFNNRISLQEGQIELRSSFNRKLDKCRKEFMTRIKGKFEALKSDFDIELGRHEIQIANCHGLLIRLLKEKNGLRIQKVSGENSHLYTQIRKPI